MPGIARVHYEIDDTLHRRAKSAAAMQGITLREFIVQALQNAVEKAEQERRGKR
jgi:predicted HicB family RNase H-like nuclease